MCGIAGYVGQGDSAALRRATKALERRGPDDEGFYEGSGVGFGFRRLSIIDVVGGRQPLSNEDGTVWVMLNGEIYNHIELREELLSLGHRFATRSDTEVIAHGYESWGSGVFSRIEGMFAIAIWDTQKQRAFLARDRMGKKPLYLARHGSSYWFASELKALIAAQVVDREIDMEALVGFFRTDAIATPKSIWKRVSKVPPASFVCITEGEVSSPTLYWQPSMRAQTFSSSFELVSALGEGIDRAVRDRLQADVPVGLFLSGGLDSAVVAASAVRQAQRPLQAFTVGFQDVTHDETASARTVATALGLDHHVEYLSESQALLMVQEAAECLDEPLADPAILPQLFLSRFAKGFVTVALAGDGGDELLYGYQHVPLHAWAFGHPKLWKYSGPFAPLIRAFPARDGYFSFGFKAQRLARGLGESRWWYRDLAWRGGCQAGDALDLLKPGAREAIDVYAPERDLEHVAKSVEGLSVWQQWSWGYLRRFLMDQVMVKVDRATMWNGIEARSPLLDHRVVELAFSFPDAYKLGSWGHKRLFRELLNDMLPHKLLMRPKHGFGVPVAAWLRGPLAQTVAAFADRGFLTRQGLFEPTTIQRWIEEHRRGLPDRRKELWAFFMFQLWYARWMKE